MSRLHFLWVLRFEFMYWCKAAESRSFCRHGAFNINKLFNLKVIAYIICSAVQILRGGVWVALLHMLRTLLKLTSDKQVHHSFASRLLTAPLSLDDSLLSPLSHRPNTRQDAAHGLPGLPHKTDIQQSFDNTVITCLYPHPVDYINPTADSTRCHRLNAL